LRYPLLFTSVLLVLILTTPAAAHHILGIPHYAYDERYPQTPILTYREDFGPFEIEMTGYPGNPDPEERCNYSVYITRLDSGEPFDGTVTLAVLQDNLVGTDPVIYGPVSATLDQSVYKFYPEFGPAANYIARISFEADGAPWIVSLPVVVGEPGNPLMLLGMIAGGLILFLVVIRAVRIKLSRRATSANKEPEPVDGLVSEGN